MEHHLWMSILSQEVPSSTGGVWHTNIHAYYFNWNSVLCREAFLTKFLIFFKRDTDLFIFKSPGVEFSILYLIAYIYRKVIYDRNLFTSPLCTYQSLDFTAGHHLWMSVLFIKYTHPQMMSSSIV